MKKSEAIELAKHGFPIKTHRGICGMSASATINGHRLRVDTAWKIINELKMETSDKLSSKIWTLPITVN